MNFISFLSTQIEKGAIFLNELIILFYHLWSLIY